VALLLLLLVLLVVVVRVRLLPADPPPAPPPLRPPAPAPAPPLRKALPAAPPPAAAAAPSRLPLLLVLLAVRVLLLLLGRCPSPCCASLVPTQPSGCLGRRVQRHRRHLGTGAGAGASASSRLRPRAAPKGRSFLCSSLPPGLSELPQLALHARLGARGRGAGRRRRSTCRALAPRLLLGLQGLHVGPAGMLLLLRLLLGSVGGLEEGLVAEWPRPPAAPAPAAAAAAVASTAATLPPAPCTAVPITPRSQPRASNRAQSQLLLG
jgi:hypothetical protein